MLNLFEYLTLNIRPIRINNINLNRQFVVARFNQPVPHHRHFCHHLCDIFQSWLGLYILPRDDHVRTDLDSVKMNKHARYLGHRSFDSKVITPTQTHTDTWNRLLHLVAELLSFNWRSLTIRRDALCVDYATQTLSVVEPVMRGHLRRVA